LLFRYYADGLIAERIDRRGVAMRYYYDDFRRLVATEVWHYPLAQPGMSHPLTSAALVAPVEYAPPCSGSSTPPPDEPPAPPAAKPGYPVAMNPTTGDPPVDRVGYIKYEYDARGNLTLVTARTGRYASSIITQTKYEYDERNNLTKEYQAHGQEATASGVAVVSYTRTYTQATPTTSGRDRLTSMTYPLTSPSLSGPYSFGFSYGATNSADDAAGRITAITRGATSIGAFTYTGSGRRVAMSMGGTATSPLIQQTFDTATTAGLEGLDRFGRSRDLHFRTTATTPTTLWRGEYTYDTAGNRTTERLAQRAPGYSALTGINERSRAFSYDSLDRLVGTKTGPLNSGNSITTPHRNEQWVLDLLGNWNGNYSTQAPAFTACDSPTIVNPGGGQFTTEPNPEGGPGGATPSLVPGHAVDEYDATGNATRVLAEAHRVAQQNPATDPLTHSTALASNAIAQIQKQTANGPAWELFRYDPNGNLTYDGKYFYQYDAWNRLVQVNDATTLHWHWFDLLGMFKLRPVGPQWPPSCPAPVLGPPIKSFVYDGVGRLARTISPITAPEGYYFAVPTGNAPPAAQYTYVTAINRSERFYYDGVRRIQEVVTNPLLVNEEHDIVTMAEELYQQNQGNTLYTGAMFTRAQYVWGPGDNGPDELLCMLDPRDSSHSSYQTLGGKPWYVLTDAQGDLVSLVHQPGATGAAQVAGQWTYSPYGQVLTYDSYVPHPVVVFGHKTLVVDRLDTAALFWNTDDGTVTEAQRLQPGVRLLAYARNRTLDIERGRWLQQDPNASGIIIAASMAIQGTPIRSMQQIISVNNRMQDGLSLYGYCVTNPVLQRDPSGLSIVGVGIGVTGGLLVPGPGDFVQGALTSLVSQYAEHQEWDVEWALDWSAGDDWHSRLDNSWVNVAMAQGVYDAFRIGVGEYSFNPLDAFASGSVGGGTRAAKSAARLSRSLAGLGSHILNILRDLKSIPTAIPSSWGRGKLAKVMDKAGAVVEVGREAGTTIYKLPDGSEVRVMPRPNRSDIAQKMAGPYYYRSRPSGDAPWGPPVSLSKE
jgi:YD repeat-containing protein